MPGNLERRLQRLEAEAQHAEATAAQPVDVGTLAEELAARWAELDTNTFQGNDYHARALSAMRDALRAMGAMA